MRQEQQDQRQDRQREQRENAVFALQERVRTVADELADILQALVRRGELFDPLVEVAGDKKGSNRDDQRRVDPEHTHTSRHNLRRRFRRNAAF